MTGEALVSEIKPLTTIGQLVPELPVADVSRAQQDYRDALGYEIGWLHAATVGAVPRGKGGTPARAETFYINGAHTPEPLDGVSGVGETRVNIATEDLHCPAGLKVRKAAQVGSPSAPGMNPAG